MATFQSMAAMMKNMKPEDIVTIIGLIQSGKLKLQENDSDTDEADVPNLAESSQTTTMLQNPPHQQMEPQLTMPFQSSRTAMRYPEQEKQVIDYSHGRVHPSGDDESQPLMSGRMSRLLGRSVDMQQMGRGGSEYDSRLSRPEREQVIDMDKMRELRQRVASGQADEDTIEMLAQLGKQLRARESQSLTGASSSMSRAPWDASEQAGLSSAVGGTGPPLTGNIPSSVDPYVSLQSEGLMGQPVPDALPSVSQSSHSIPGLHTLEEQVQDQQHQNLAEHQALLQQIMLHRQEQSSGQLQGLTQDLGQSVGLAGGLGSIPSVQASEMDKQALLGQMSRIQMQQQSVPVESGMLAQNFGQTELDAALVPSLPTSGGETNVAATQYLQQLQSLPENASLQALQMQPQLAQSLPLGSASLQTPAIQSLTGQVVMAGDKPSVQTLGMQTYASQGSTVTHQSGVQLQTQQSVGHHPVLAGGEASAAQSQTQHQASYPTLEQDKARATQLQASQSISAQDEARLAQLQAQQQAQQLQQQASHSALAQDEARLAQLRSHQAAQQEAQALEQARHAVLAEVEARVEKLLAQQQQFSQSLSSIPLAGQAASHGPVPLMDIRFQTPFHQAVPPQESRKRKIQDEEPKAASGVAETSIKQRKMETERKVVLVKKCTWCSSDQHSCKDCHLLKGETSGGSGSKEATKKTDKPKAGTTYKDAGNPQEDVKKPTDKTTNKDVSKASPKTNGSAPKKGEESKTREQSKEKTSQPESKKATTSQYSDSSYKEILKKRLDVRLKPLLGSKKNVKIKHEIETDLLKLELRMLDVDKVKDTSGYRYYRKKILRAKREKGKHPQTPDIFQKCTLSSWDDQMNKWRKALKPFEPKEMPEKESQKASRKSKSPDKPHNYICSLCNFADHDLNKFERHLESKEHLKKKPAVPNTKAAEVVKVKKDGKFDYICVDCNEIYSVATSYQQHLQSKDHRRRVAFACSLCDSRCTSASNLQNHLQSQRHLTACAKCIPCPLCDLTYKSQKSYMQHVTSNKHKMELTKKESSPKLNILGCSYCKVACQTSEQFQIHLYSTKHITLCQSKTILMCIACREPYDTKERYIKHLESKVHHDNLEKFTVKALLSNRYVCMRCDFKSQDFKEYQQHCESRDVALQHQLTCNVCNFRKFQDTKQYKEHLMSKKHQATLSAKKEVPKLIPKKETPKLTVKKETPKLTVKKELPKLAAKKETPKQDLFMCKPCKFKCQDAKEYEKHLASEGHRGKLVKEFKISTFDCNKCQVNFSSLEKYEQHLLGPKHIEKVGGHFVCKLCKKDCKTYVEYKLHLSSKTHKEESATLRCTQCRVSLKDKKTYNAHTKSRYHSLVTGIQNKEILLDMCRTCNIKFSDLKSIGEHLQDTQHIYIMTVRGGIKCLLCSWKAPEGESFKTACPSYLEHLRMTQHVTDIAQLCLVFGSWQNIFRQNDEMYCADCKANYSGYAELHKCPGGKKNDPNHLCTIVVEENAAVASCSLDLIKSYFRQFGEIEVAFMKKQPKLHQTFITYRWMSSANDVMDVVQLGGLSVKGTHMDIKRVLPDQFPDEKIASTIFFSNLGKDINRVDLFNYFSKYGRIAKIFRSPPDKTSGGFGYVIYDLEASIQKACDGGGAVKDMKSTHQIQSHSVVCYTLVSAEEASCKVLLKSLPQDMSPLNLGVYFGRYGAVKAIKVFRDVYIPASQGCGIVRFKNRAPADKVKQDGVRHRFLGKIIECVKYEQVISKVQISNSDSSQEVQTTKMKEEPEEVEDMTVVDEWFEGDLEDEPDAGIPGVDQISSPSPPHHEEPVSPVKSKWENEEDFIGVQEEAKTTSGTSKDDVILPATGTGGSTSPNTLDIPSVAPTAKSSSTTKVSKSVTFKVPESPTFKVPQMVPPARAKKVEPSKVGIKQAVKQTGKGHSPVVVRMSGVKPAQASASEGSGKEKQFAVRGVLEEPTTESQDPNIAKLTYYMKGLPNTTKEGDVWQYFQKLGIGEIQSVFVARKKGTGWLKLSGVGREQEKKLTGSAHAIKGGAVKCFKMLKETSGAATPVALHTEEVKEFTAKIPDILQEHPGWKGTCRGIEYVTAGFVCNICQWFYKALPKMLPSTARKEHMTSNVHAKQDIGDIDEKEFGTQGVYCRVCNDFVKSKPNERALNTANEHCILLKHHLHVKLNKLQHRQALPKWLQNPLYSEGKKRKFMEEVVFKQPEPVKPPESKPKPQKSPEIQTKAKETETVGVPGLKIVHYESSDDEMSDEETAEDKASTPSGNDNKDGESVEWMDEESSEWFFSELDDSDEEV